MFTGIVTHHGIVEQVEAAGDVTRLRLVVEPTPLAVAIGDSVAVNGVCLTVTAVDGAALAFDVIPETLRRTTLGRVAPGARLNLEAALRMGDPLGGHWVEGHVEATGTVAARSEHGEDVRLVIAVPEALYPALLPKGCAAIDGVSLTVGDVWREGGSGRFDVYLIPHTLAVTTLGSLAEGDAVNLEADVLGRWVRRHVERLLGDAGILESGRPAADDPM